VLLFICSINPNFLNVDLTATKKFGKWEIGPVGFYSTDLNSPIAGYQKQSQFAVGGLIGYDFGPVIMQAYLTTDVYEKNYGGHDTRLWGRISFLLATRSRPHRRCRIQRGRRSSDSERQSSNDRAMSALGQKQTYALQQAMSALHPKATAKA
jgi:outer membrane putative beta-barrel porin/alpha-amylase